MGVNQLGQGLPNFVPGHQLLSPSNCKGHGSHRALFYFVWTSPKFATASTPRSPEPALPRWLRAETSPLPPEEWD
jgi:hypothetical protein